MRNGAYLAFVIAVAGLTGEAIPTLALPSRQPGELLWAQATVQSTDSFYVSRSPVVIGPASSVGVYWGEVIEQPDGMTRYLLYTSWGSQEAYIAGEAGGEGVAITGKQSPIQASSASVYIAPIPWAVQSGSVVTFFCEAWGAPIDCVARIGTSSLAMTPADPSQGFYSLASDFDSGLGISSQVADGAVAVGLQRSMTGRAIVLVQGDVGSVHVTTAQNHEYDAKPLPDIGIAETSNGEWTFDLIGLNALNGFPFVWAAVLPGT